MSNATTVADVSTSLLHTFFDWPHALITLAEKGSVSELIELVGNEACPDEAVAQAFLHVIIERNVQAFDLLISHTPQGKIPEDLQRTMLLKAAAAGDFIIWYKLHTTCRLIPFNDAIQEQGWWTSHLKAAVEGDDPAIWQRVIGKARESTLTTPLMEKKMLVIIFWDALFTHAMEKSSRLVAVQLVKDAPEGTFPQLTFLLAAIAYAEKSTQLQKAS